VLLDATGRVPRLPGSAAVKVNHSKVKSNDDAKPVQGRGLDL
jgi:hypothetical protein